MFSSLSLAAILFPVIFSFPGNSALLLPGQCPPTSRFGDLRWTAPQTYDALFYEVVAGLPFDRKPARLFRNISTRGQVELRLFLRDSPMTLRLTQHLPDQDLDVEGELTFNGDEFSGLFFNSKAYLRPQMGGYSTPCSREAEEKIHVGVGNSVVVLWACVEGQGTDELRDEAVLVATDHVSSHTEAQVKEIAGKFLSQELMGSLKWTLGDAQVDFPTHLLCELATKPTQEPPQKASLSWAVLSVFLGLIGFFGFLLSVNIRNWIRLERLYRGMP